MRTSVNEELDLPSGDESDKPLYVMVGMPDGPQYGSLQQHAHHVTPRYRRKAGTTPRPGNSKPQLLLYLMCIPEMAREMTSCWISAVPSKMS